MNLEEKAILIVKKLVRKGYIAYFAGGSVRDQLMDQPCSDIDIATNAPPSVILDLFPHTIPVGIAFGVVIVVMEDHPFEVSTFRRDISYLNGRKPEAIELATPEEDALRRDFTINGLFYDPLENCIYDYVGGKEDIQKGIIRTIGSASERFFEDRLRMIRAIRFSAKFGFAIDKGTEEGIYENSQFLFPAVAIERVWQELTKMSQSSCFEQAIFDMHRLGLLQEIFPSLKNVHLKTIRHWTRYFKWFPRGTDPLLYIMEIFPEINFDDLMELCAYLKVSRSQTALAAFHYRYRELILNSEKMDKRDLVSFYSNPASQSVIEIQAAHLQNDAEEFLNDHASKRLQLTTHIERMIQKKPLITGFILGKEGILPGKKMGALLKEAEVLTIVHDLKKSEDVIGLLKQSPLWIQNEG